MAIKTAETAILAASFGKGRNGTFNAANLRIANRAIATALEENYNSDGKPLILADSSVNMTIAGTSVEVFTLGNKNPEIHDSTNALVKQALKECLRRGIKKLIVLSADPYSWRLFRDVKKVFRGSGIVVQRAAKIGGKWFFPDSTQWWTTKWWLWWMREIPLRTLNLFCYPLYAWLTDKLA